MPLIDLVVADESEAQGVGAAGAPIKTFLGIEAKDIGPVKLAKLALILDGVPLDTPTVINAVQSFALLHESSEDGPWVLRVPNRLVAALGSLDVASRVAVAGAWASVEEFARDGWDTSAVSHFLDSLCGLAEETQGARYKVCSCGCRSDLPCHAWTIVGPDGGTGS